MKRIITVLTALIIAAFSAISVFAAEGTVTYSGDAGEFIFKPGSEYSPTDLFPEFKDVMPGDSLTQKITVKNDASKNVKVKIYIRALGAHENSREFLSQLNLRVAKSADNTMEYMFDATAEQAGQLDQWVELGTLYSGGVVNLDVFLDVPTTLDNTYADNKGYLDWEFMVEEYPTEEGDPNPPQTGDDFNIKLWIILLICSIAVMIILLLWHKKKQKAQQAA